MNPYEPLVQVVSSSFCSLGWASVQVLIDPLFSPFQLFDYSHNCKLVTVFSFACNMLCQVGMQKMCFRTTGCVNCV